MGSAVGTLALNVGGQLIGGALFGPAGAAIGGIAGGLIGSMLFNRAQKPLVTDYQLANSSYGRPIPLIYGQWRAAGTVIWETTITIKSSSTRGKGAGGGGGGVAYTYYQSAAFAFVQGPARLLKVWLDGKLFYDATSTNPNQILDDPKAGFLFRIYQGTEDQLADSLIESWVADNVTPGQACPAYRGLAYFVCQGIPLNYFGNRMPNFTAAWATDVNDHIFLTKFTPNVADTTFQPVNAGNPVSIQGSADWTSLTTYVLDAYTGQVSMFNMQTGQEIMYKSWDQLFGGQTPPYPQNTFPVDTICKVPGGGLYLAWGPGAASRFVFFINPNNLVVNSWQMLPANPVNSAVWPTVLVGFQLVSALVGAVDMLVRIDSNFQSPLIFNPISGNCSAFLALQWSNAFGVTNCVVGKQDTIGGTTELWFASSNFFGTATIYIYKVVVGSEDPSGIQNADLQGIVTPADFNGSSGTFFDNPSLAYSPADDTVIISSSAGVIGSIKWSPAVGTIWFQSTPAMNSPFTGQSFDLSSGPIGNGNVSGFHVTDSSTGQVVWTDNSTPGTELPSAGGLIYSYNSSINGLVYFNGTTGSYTMYVAYLQRVTLNEISVGAILQDLCERAGIPTNQIDVSLVTATTQGYALTDERAYGSAVADLCHIYNIDMVESDYTLKFVPRGGAAVVTITQDDLSSIDQDQAHFWEPKRALEQEMPLQVNVRYYDPAIDYQTGSTYAKRTALPVPTVYSRRTKTIDLPIVASNQEANVVAQTWLWTMWAERETYQSKLGPKYLWLDPTDNVIVTLTEPTTETLTVRIESNEVGDDYSMAILGASEDIDTYFPSVVTIPNISQKPQTITQSPGMNLLQFNIPLLLDTDDLGGTQERGYFMAAPIATVTGTDSATLYQSTDGGSTFPQVATVSSFANWGYGQANGILGDTVSKFATDYVNTVVVSVIAGSVVPTNVTYQQLLNGANVAILGQEVIAFQTATRNADGTYTLSVLLRGRRGTEWATGTHVAGEEIVFIENSDVLGLALPLGQIGVSELYKLVPFGQIASFVSPTSFTYKGYDLKPYAPVHFEWEASGSDLVLTWFRRSRLGGGDGLVLDGSDSVALGEASEAYEVYFISGPSALETFNPATPSTYIRKFQTIVPTLTYTATQMATDGFTMGTDELYCVGYQVSAVVGRGFQGYQQAAPGSGPVIGVTGGGASSGSGGGAGPGPSGGGGPPVVTPPPHSATNYTVSNGKIIKSDGTQFRAKGINILGPGLANVDLAVFQSLFPNANQVRLAIGGGLANGFLDQDPTTSDVINFVNTFTGAGIVVVIENHVQDGGQPAFTNSYPVRGALDKELGYWESLATTFISNPNVWFGTENEMVNPISANHLAVYQAIRGTGNNNIIMLCSQGGNPADNGGMPDDLSVYLGMHNVCIDQHYYNWMDNGATSQTVANTTLQDSLDVWAANLITADGPAVVWIGECGPINYVGDPNVDAGGAFGTNQVVDTAMVYAPNGGAIFLWNGKSAGFPTVADLVNYDDTTLTAHGTYLVSIM